MQQPAAAHGSVVGTVTERVYRAVQLYDVAVRVARTCLHSFLYFFFLAVQLSVRYTYSDIEIPIYKQYGQYLADSNLN